MCPKCKGQKTFCECVIVDREAPTLRWYIDCDDCEAVYTVEPSGAVSKVWHYRRTKNG